jgi:hypothetical protein
MFQFSTSVRNASLDAIETTISETGGTVTVTRV